MSQTLHRLLDRALTAPVIADVLRSRYDRAFRQGRRVGSCRGVYDSYAEAAAHAPRSAPLGYDHEAPAHMYRDRLFRVFPGDFPMMLWLGKAFAAGRNRVFDLGGHVGIGYYAYRKYLDYPADLQWRVLDVPAVMKRGREIAQEKDSHGRLSFADAFAEASGADVLFTSGCLQYLEESLAIKLAQLERRPGWVLVNLLPLHEQREYWTVQSIGTAFCPYRIQRRQTFFSALMELGYEVLDVWENVEKRCEIAFEPQLSLDRYHGAALRLLPH